MIPETWSRDLKNGLDESRDEVRRLRAYLMLTVDALDSLMEDTNYGEPPTSSPSAPHKPYSPETIEKINKVPMDRVRYLAYLERSRRKIQ